jgi:glycosyltransferase involved in cell wall biosynthesis
VRILFLTNMYLEEGWGGEDVSCRQVVEGLKERGHSTLVLTSMHGTQNVPSVANGVHRSLYLEMDFVPWRNSLTFFTQRKAREAHNLKCLDQALEQFTPDIVFIWGMWNLPRSLAALAEARFPDRVVYRFASYWPTLPSQYELYWRAPGQTWYGRPVKRLLASVALAMLAGEKRRAPLAFRHAICVSAAVRDRLVEAGIPIAHARIIHTGLDAERYPDHRQRLRRDDPPALHLLYAGRLVPEKGVDTAIGALERLVWSHGLRSIQLSLAGSGPAEYESHLRQLVSQARLNDHVTFLGHVEADRMPHLLQQFDVAVVPSKWPEPFSRTVLEGMVSGLAVVATPTGGTPEILKHGENGLLFAPGNADDLAQQILGLLEDPGLRRTLATAGRQTVVERFTSTRMLNEIERVLQGMADPSAQPTADRQEEVEPDAGGSSLPTLSVILPTYNRKESLLGTLQALAQQTYPSDHFEVIVVDDGSTDGTDAIAVEDFPFAVRYVRQSNQGDAAARNLGARHSQAELLVFLDDDMLLDPNYLGALVQAQEGHRRRIVAGAWNPWLPESTPLVEALQTSQLPDDHAATTELSFADIHSNNMALRREAFFEIGMMQSLAFSGSSIWCDLDFNYRAFQKGFEFRRSRQAVCWHQDHHIRTLEVYSQRWRTAAYRAVVLFQKYPELVAHTPMFHDKTPVTWGKDSPRLIARKLARSIASTRASLWCMEQAVRALEKRRPESGILKSLYRYVIGGYIFRGYREGLGAFGHIKT